MRSLALTPLLALFVACAEADSSPRPDGPSSQNNGNGGFEDTGDWVDEGGEGGEGNGGDEPVPEGCEGPEGMGIGDCAPDFTLTSSKGTEVSLSDFGGKRVIVLGSATW